ncbi:uncharacterized protein LOC108604049 [Drosophila busckii]|uniref:uncharacterized protein LOC108604049 n=1 Tax=Drosophila busckii TaxID=30019 RepID=UPI00083EB4B1|nr:uncharacterized protein LOC108604049 [Drosophila busckii]
MKRRCLICGQVPTDGHTFPKDIKEARKWQKYLSVYVPAEMLRRHSCICNKHLSRSQRCAGGMHPGLPNDINEPRLCVTFKESDVIKYFGASNASAFDANLANGLQPVNTGTFLRIEGKKLNIGGTQSSTSVNSYSPQAMQSHKRPVFGYNNLNFQSTSGSSCMSTSSSCLSGSSKNPVRITLGAQRSSSGSVMGSTPKLRRRKEYQDCQCYLQPSCCDQEVQCPARNRPKPTTMDCNEPRRPPCPLASPAPTAPNGLCAPKVNVLIMGGSMLPTYYNSSASEPCASQLEVCVLESDFTQERAVFADIDQPKYTVCRATPLPATTEPKCKCGSNSSTDVLVLGLEQPAESEQCLCNHASINKTSSSRGPSKQTAPAASSSRRPSKQATAMALPSNNHELAQCICDEVLNNQGAAKMKSNSRRLSKQAELEQCICNETISCNPNQSASKIKRSEFNQSASSNRRPPKQVTAMSSNNEAESRFQLRSFQQWSKYVISREQH